MINVACTPCDVAPTGTATEPAPYYAAVFAMRAPAPPAANTNLHFTRDPNGEWRCGARYGRRGCDMPEKAYLLTTPRHEYYVRYPAGFAAYLHERARVPTQAEVFWRRPRRRVPSRSTPQQPKSATSSPPALAAALISWNPAAAVSFRGVF